MSDNVGRAGFHVTHTKAIAERGAILHEMMRELDQDSITYWAARNPNIVVADEAFNEAYVNDGEGGFLACTNRQDVLDYGNRRRARMTRAIREDTLDPKTGTMRGGTVTTTMIVAHLPKSMCVEVPDFYPVLDGKTGAPVLRSDGTPMKRSRFVARDRDEARRYFADVLRIIEDHVLPGGRDAVLGFDIQHSESTPHIQILADAFAPDPQHPGGLRAEASRAWFSHRDVRDDSGRQKSGATKLREYHARLKAELIKKGYDISPDFDDESHMIGYAKADYARVQDQRRQITDREEGLVRAERLLRDKQAELDRDAAELPRLRRQAMGDGYEKGRELAERDAAEDLAAARQARGDAALELDKIRREHQQLQSLTAQIASDLQQAGEAPRLPSYEEAREAILGSQSAVALRFLRSIKLTNGTTLYDQFEAFARADFAKARANGKSTTDFEAWRSRTEAAQRRISDAQLKILRDEASHAPRPGRIDDELER